MISTAKTCSLIGSPDLLCMYLQDRSEESGKSPRSSDESKKGYGHESQTTVSFPERQTSLVFFTSVESRNYLLLFLLHRRVLGVLH